MWPHSSDGHAPLPRDRFGQFCAANGMTIALGMMAGGFVVGKFLGALKAPSPAAIISARADRPTVFYTISIILTYALFRSGRSSGATPHTFPPVADAFAPQEAAENRPG